MSTPKPALVTPNGRVVEGQVADTLARAIDDWTVGRSTSVAELESLVAVLNTDPIFAPFTALFPPILAEKNDAKRKNALRAVGKIAEMSGEQLVPQ